MEFSTGDKIALGITVILVSAVIIIIFLILLNS